MGRIYGHILLYTCMKISKTKKKCEVEIKTPKTCIGEKAAVLGKIDISRWEKESRPLAVSQNNSPHQMDQRVKPEILKWLAENRQFPARYKYRKGLCD